MAYGDTQSGTPRLGYNRCHFEGAPIAGGLKIVPQLSLLGCLADA